MALIQRTSKNEYLRHYSDYKMQDFNVVRNKLYNKPWERITSDLKLLKNGIIDKAISQGDQEWIIIFPSIGMPTLKLAKFLQPFLTT